jgi:hypothetical protein
MYLSARYRNHSQRPSKCRNLLIAGPNTRGAKAYRVTAVEVCVSAPPAVGKGGWCTVANCSAEQIGQAETC